MVYTIEIHSNKDLPFPESSDSLADVTVRFDNVVIVSGIKIKERADKRLYVEMPKINDKKSLVVGKSNFYATPCDREFAVELYSNIIKTYVSKKSILEVDVTEPSHTNYTINAYPSVSDGKIGIVNLELEGCIKLRGIELKQNFDGSGYFLNSPKYNMGEFSCDVFTLDNDFEQDIIKNALPIIEEIKLAGYSQEDINSIKSIESDIKNEESNLRTCDRMTNLIIKDIVKYEAELDSLDTNSDRYTELNGKMNYLYNQLGQFGYAYHVTTNKLNELKDKLKSKMDDINDKNKVADTKKKRSGVR